MCISDEKTEKNLPRSITLGWLEIVLETHELLRD